METDNDLMRAELEKKITIYMVATGMLHKALGKTLGSLKGYRREIELLGHSCQECDAEVEGKWLYDNSLLPDAEFLKVVLEKELLKLFTNRTEVAFSEGYQAGINSMKDKK